MGSTPNSDLKFTYTIDSIDEIKNGDKWDLLGLGKKFFSLTYLDFSF